MIWTREVNASMLEHIKSLMEGIVDHYKKPLNIKVIMRHPNMDVSSESYPKITIYNLAPTENLGLSDVNSFELTDLGGGMVRKSNIPSNYVIHYQIDFWSESPIHMDTMTYIWAINNPKHSQLEVLDSNGSDTHVCAFTQYAPKKMDSVDSKGRNIFRTMFNCDVVVRLQNNKFNDYQMVGDIKIQKEEY